MLSGGREVAEIDDAYLLHCESEHAARTCTANASGPSAEHATAQLELGSGASSAGRRLKRKAVLSMISKWTVNGVPVNLFRDISESQPTTDLAR